MQEQEMAEKNLILKFLAGSHAYGTNTSDSDKDYLGVFIPDEEYVIGNKVCEQVEIRTNKSGSGKKNTKEDTDTVIYSLPKFLKLLRDNNPTILETLYFQKKNVVFCNSMGQRLIDARGMFPSKQVKSKFLGYALSQRKHLTHKKERWEALGTALRQLDDWEREGFKTLPDSLNLPSALREDKTWGFYQNGQEIGYVRDIIIGEITSYGHRVYDIQTYGFSTKFASHTIRLLSEGLTFLVEGDLKFPLPNNNLIRDIKMGKYPLEAILAMATAQEKLVEEAYVNSKLPVAADAKAIDRFQMEMLKDFWGYSKQKTWLQKFLGQFSKQ